MDPQIQQVVYVAPDTSRRRNKAFGFGAISLISGIILIVTSLVISTYYIYTGVLIVGILLVIKGIVFIIYGFRLYRQAQNPDPSQASCIVVASGVPNSGPYLPTTPYPPMQYPPTSPVGQEFRAPPGNASYPQQQYVTQTQFKPSCVPPGNTSYPGATPAGAESPPPYVEPK